MNNTNQQVSEIMVSYKPIRNVNSQLVSSFDAVKLMRKVWNEGTIEMQEEVKVILLNHSNLVFGIYDLSKGGMTASLVDIRLILSVALKCLATGIILVHNHPSGNLNPSKSDLNIVQKLKECCNLFDIVLLDNLIITKHDFLSFADDGLL